jgi:uncharacterized protein (DUF1330 family)
MASYVMSMMNKHDLVRYGEYSAQGFVSLEGLPFEVIVGENLETLEGTAPGTSVVVMKFPDNAAAMAWYRSEAYQKAIPLRQAAAETIFAVHFTDDQ